MKTRLLFISLSCLFLLSHSTFAQQAPPQVDFMKMRQSPAIQQSMKSGMKTILRSFWEGRGTNLMVIGLSQDPEVKAAFGISDEQQLQIQEFQRMQGTALQEKPEFKKLVEEMQAIQDPNDPYMQNLDEETATKFSDLQGKIISLSMDYMSDTIDNILTGEQKQKMMEAQLASMGEMPMVSPGMFDVLNLTDIQRQQMEEIKKELEPEFEKVLESFADNAMMMSNKLLDELGKQGGFEMDRMRGENHEEIQKGIKEMQDKIASIQKKLMTEDPEYKEIAEEMQSQGKIFVTQFKTKMFDVLDDEQWARLQTLIDNPPAYANVFLKKIKEQSAQTEKAGGGWQPGPNSWKPGDPIPEQYRQERSKRRGFPRAEQE